MKRVLVYEIGPRIQTVEADFLEFHSHPGFSLHSGDWKQPVNNSEKYVRYSAPIHRLHQGGEDFYVALGPGCTDRLAAALQPELARRIKDLEGKVEHANREGAAASRLGEQLRVRCVEWREEATELSNKIHRANFWNRLMYAFTGRLL